MRYVEARIEEFNRDEAYRIFVTTSLQLAPQQKYLTKGYSELLERKEEKSGDEIAVEIMQKAGLKFSR